MTRTLLGVEIQGKVWSIKISLFINPTDSKELYIWELRKKANNELLSSNIKYVKFKMVKLKINLREEVPMRVYCIPHLHQ